MLKKITPELIIAILITGVVFLFLPFVYFTSLYDPESSPRFGIFSLLIAAVTLWYLIRGKKEHILNYLAKNKVFACYLLLVFVYILNGFRSYNGAEAIYDCIRHGSMLLFLLLAVVVLQKSRNYFMLFVAGVAIAILIFALFAWPQIIPAYLKSRELHQKFIPRFDMCSTLSNKNFFAETVVMSIPFLLIGIINGNWLLKILAFISLLVCIPLLILLQGMSSWLAVGAFILAFIVFQFFFTGTAIPKKYKIALAIIVLAGAVASGVFLFKKQAGPYNLFIKAKSTLRYLSDTKIDAKIEYSSTTERILLWKHTLKIVKHNPVMGLGTANWKSMFPIFGKFGVEFMDSGNLRFEHPHNDYLLLASEQGLPGLILYLLIFILAIRHAFIQCRGATNNKDRQYYLLLACGIVLFMTLSFFEFPYERFYTLLLLTLMLAGIIAPGKETEPAPVTSIKYSRIVFASIIVLSLFSFRALYARAGSEQHYNKAINLQPHHKWQEMSYHISKAKNTYYTADMMQIPMDWYKGFALFYMDSVPRAKDYFTKAVKQNPFFAQGWNDLGTCYEREMNYTEAIKCYKTSLAINDKLSKLNLTAAYYNSGNLDSAYIIISSLKGMSYAYLDYSRFLLAILRAKIYTRLEELKWQGNPDNIKEYNDDKYIIEIYEKAYTTNQKVEDLFIESVGIKNK